MTTQKKRAYNSTHRNAQAAQTRGRILEAASNLFKTEGFEGVTIERLAQAAQVSAPTVYSLFQSKRGVLFALMDEIIPASELDALVEKAKQEKSPLKRITYGAKIARCIYDAERAQMDLFRSASVLAPEFKELEQEREKRRYYRQEETILEMAKIGALLKGMTTSQARDILWALTGRDLYRMLVVERGWTSDAYEEWLSELLIKTLINNNV